MVLCWFSCGVTSAVACHIAINTWCDSRIIFIRTGSEHPDSYRFLHDCEKWFDREIEIYQSQFFTSHWDVIEHKNFINSPYGAPCTMELKKKVRYRIEDSIKDWDMQIFGFDCSELTRFCRFNAQYPKAKARAPLIEKNLSKADCMAIVQNQGIKLPQMYLDGFPNNNCIGCVKGGKSYWALIRKKYPDAFRKMSEIENRLGHSCIKDCFLKELPENYSCAKPIVPSCSLFCDPDFMNI